MTVANNRLVDGVAKALYESAWGGPAGWETCDQDFWRLSATSAIKAMAEAVPERTHERRNFCVQGSCLLCRDDRVFNEARHLLLGASE